jgi:hypothetical protein
MRLRSAWIQTSLRIRAVLSGSMLFAISFFTCYRVCKGTAWILIRLRGSMLVANPLYWFCHDTAQLSLFHSKIDEMLQQVQNAGLTGETRPDTMEML